MEININDQQKLVEIWLTREESQNQDLKASLQDLYAQYKAKNYLVAVFQSGEKDLYDSTLGLLLYNRKRSAQKAVRA